ASNVVVNTADVVLMDTVIEGNLYLAAGIGNGDVTLKGVTVKGKTYVNGGGANSIGLVDSNINDVEVNKQGDEGVRIFASGSTSVGNITVNSNAKLEESELASDSEGFGHVQVTSNGSHVELVGDFDE